MLVKVLFLIGYGSWDLNNTEELYGISRVQANYAVLFDIHAIFYKGENFNYQINLLGQIIKPGNSILRCHNN